MTSVQIAGDEKFWSQHMASLRRIIAQRRDVFPSEPYRYVVFWAGLIDICALLSGRGEGALVADIGRAGGNLSAEEMLQCLDFIGPSGTHGVPKALESCPNPELTMSAARIFQFAVRSVTEVGFLARSMRTAAPERDGDAHAEQRCGWLHRIAGLRSMITREWHAQIALSNGLAERLAAADREDGPDGMAVDLIEWVRASYPFLFAAEHAPCVRPDIIECLHPYKHNQATLIYHASILYTHTSMFPEQPLYFDPATERRSLVMAASVILDRATAAFASPNPRFERRYFVFALFIAGAALAVTIPPRLYPSARRSSPLAGGALVESGAGPPRALELLRMLDAVSIGRSTAATCRLLESVMDASAAARVAGRGEDGPVAVDWIALAEETGVEIVLSGF